ncbi:MAG: hypothetical protein H2B05_00490 [Nitrosopumilaceae archaeon]|uniref:Uncharacterized protein n=1 Tax=Candidatus Nitrosomaritimum aestuariumsis TaxID=3342354 RepID=A0AC60W1E6_9ARCH|nr:hypothetical protein [Nitrosopumilaceae archaeon]
MLRRCLFKIRLVCYVSYRQIESMEIKAIAFSDSQNNLDFEKFIKNVGFYQR